MNAEDFFTGPLYYLMFDGRGVFIFRTYLFGKLLIAAVGLFPLSSFLAKSISLRSSLTICLTWLFEFFYATWMDLF